MRSITHSRYLLYEWIILLAVVFASWDDIWKAFPIDENIIISAYGRIAKYNDLINTTHFDKNDKMWFRVSSIEYYEIENEIIGHRIQIAMPGYPIGRDGPFTDCITVSEIMECMGDVHMV